MRDTYDSRLTILEDRFSIEKHYASRTAAKVYLARDKQTGEMVRIKRMNSDVAPHQQYGGIDYLHVLQRQYDEIKSPSLLPMLDYGLSGEGVWIAVPHDETTDLLKKYSEPMPYEEFDRMASQLLGLLGKAH